MSQTVKAPVARWRTMSGPDVGKLWSRTKPLRVVMAWVFVLHGWLHLGADLASGSQPFVLADVRDWWGWTADRWQDVQVLWDQLRGTNVEVS